MVAVEAEPQVLQVQVGQVRHLPRVPAGLTAVAVVVEPQVALDQLVV
jgi:hypothetical protein